MSHPFPSVIYRLIAADVWQAAQAVGHFSGTAHDERDGFIHFSSASQVADTAARHYAGQSGLLLLWVDAAALGPALRWEPSRGGALFPHLYATLPTAAVTRVDALPLGANGVHVFARSGLRAASRFGRIHSESGSVQLGN